MGVYVDSLLRYPGNRRHPGNPTCHLFADSEPELHAFAARIGMRREWAQVGRRGVPHYDLNGERRTVAIALGALPLSRRESVAKWRILRGEAPATAPSEA